ncbi:MAG: DUF6265 family protein [Pirellulales bacterium]|nr:DUF6265 family protein [Pirellulales bacterium]
MRVLDLKRSSIFPITVVLFAFGLMVLASRPQDTAAQSATTCAAQTNAAVEEPLAGLAWMTGDWHGESGPVSYEETWTSPADGNMTGMFRMLNGGKFSLSEHLSIGAEKGEIVLRLIHFDRELKPHETEPVTLIAKESAKEKSFSLRRKEQSLP